jgi:hypothetical protein
MSVIAEVEQTIPGPIDAVFARFIDYPSWTAWMPALFTPLRGPSRPLVQGDRLLVRVKGLPTTLTVDRLEASRQVCWSAGLPGFLHGRHTFTFEAVDSGSTRIRSVEPWTGLLTYVVASSLQRAAEDGGRQQLQGFDRWFRDQFAGRAS